MIILIVYETDFFSVHDGRTIVLKNLTIGALKKGFRVIWRKKKSYKEILYSEGEVCKIELSTPPNPDVVWIREFGDLRSVRKLDATVIFGANDLKVLMAIDRLRREVKYRRKAIEIVKSAVRIPYIYMREALLFSRIDAVHLQTAHEAKKASIIYPSVRILICQNGIDKVRSSEGGVNESEYCIFSNFTGLRKYEAVRLVDKVVRGRSDDFYFLGEKSNEMSSLFGNNIPYMNKVDDLGLFLGKFKLVIIPTDHTTGVVNRIMDCVAVKRPFLVHENSMTNLSYLFDDCSVFTYSDANDLNEIINSMSGERLDKMRAGVDFAEKELRLWCEFQEEVGDFLLDIMDGSKK